MTQKNNNIENNPENEKLNPFAQKNEEEAKNESSETAEQPNEPESGEKKIQNELDTLNNQYLRLAADFDNFRKRTAQERETLLKYGAEDTLKKLLPILDTFERAKKSISEMDDPQKIKESFEVLYKQFADALEKTGLQKIETEGKEFNPEFHEAVMQTPSNDHADHAVINELQSGYKLNERVLRPALVNVAVNE